MRIVGLFDIYFLIIIIIQYLVSNFIDVKELKDNNYSKEATILKRTSLGILIVSLILFVVSNIYQ